MIVNFLRKSSLLLSNIKYLPKRYLATVKSWSFDTDPFGSLSLHSKRFADVYIKTLDPQAFPQMNKAFIDVISVNDTNEFTAKGPDLEVSMNSKFEINISSEIEKEDDLKILVRIPIKFGWLTFFFSIEINLIH